MIWAEDRATVGADDWLIEPRAGDSDRSPLLPVLEHNHAPSAMVYIHVPSRDDKGVASPADSL